MKSSFLKSNTIFKKLFILTFLISVVPIGLSWIYFFLMGNEILPDARSSLPLVYYGLFLLTLVLAAAGAFYFSKKISRPLTHLIQSATEIARGNFSQKVTVEADDEVGRLARIFNYMTTELRRLKEMNLNEIINERNKTKTILKNIGDGVIVTDSSNKVLLINTVAELWFGLKNSTLATDRPIDEAISNQNLIKFIRETNSNGENRPQSIEIPLEPRDGWKSLVLQARAARIVNEKSELIGIVTILRDITREKEIDRMKTELVSMVAHELRSPLTCIAGFSELLMDNTVTREQSGEYAEIILKESNRLGDLINKFLDISKIEAGKSQVHKSPVDMKMLIEKVLDFNSQLAEKKKIRVNFESPAEVRNIMVDRDMLEQVILNLYSNAVKYSPDRAEVTVRLFDDDKELAVEVRDTGYGISETSLPHIFEKFYRVTDNEKVIETTGSGLGLALVKEIVEIHGGKIKVESTLGKGSIFSFILPRVDQFQSEVKPEAAAA
jgi:PAS domain S-box-containing protein